MTLTRRDFAAGVSSVAVHTAFAAGGMESPRAVVFNVEKMATHDGPGIRTVAFLKGCPLRCVWCHSPASWNYRIERYSNGETVGVEMTAEALLAEVLKDKDFYDATKGGVTLSGGEPLAQADFCEAFFRGALRRALSAVADGGDRTPPIDLSLRASVENAGRHSAQPKHRNG